MKTLPCLIALLIALPVFASEEAEKNLKPYPPAREGMVRHVIVLPHRERDEEEDYRVELIVGKTLLGDRVNRMRLGGRLEEKTVEGWGYTYFEASAGPVASTLMAPMPGEAPVERFVTLPPHLVRYNSRLPLVVYTPADMVVRYRIWKAGEETLEAVKR